MDDDHCVGFFRLLSEPTNVEEIASGREIRELEGLNKSYGAGRWRKMKGRATIETYAGEICDAEVHWYEAHGIGRRRIKAKRVFRQKRRS